MTSHAHFQSPPSTSSSSISPKFLIIVSIPHIPLRPPTLTTLTSTDQSAYPFHYPSIDSPPRQKRILVLNVSINIPQLLSFSASPTSVPALQPGENLAATTNVALTFRKKFVNTLCFDMVALAEPRCLVESLLYAPIPLGFA